MVRNGFASFFSVYSALQLTQWMLIKLIQTLQPYLRPMCLVVAWAVVILGVWQIVATVRDSVKRAQQMHQIPCAGCKFFTNSRHLKCPLHPVEALSEQAINCPDFEVANPVLAASLRQQQAGQR
jgi:hypothetical protein